MELPSDRSASLGETLASLGDEGIVRDPDGALGGGAVVGRFVVVSRLGEGAMGVVYLAYDPELDRRVALKLLRPGTGDGQRASAGRGRLLREARALAKLSHPNVVAVHDVGTVDDRVWIAMEFVEGSTLTDWARGGTRDWGAVVGVMREAGAGLAAAHAQGLLHRDFKPDNVMVGDDGRVRVMDFGLARANDDETTSTIESAAAAGVATSAASIAADGLAARMTRTGALMGTPAYMSPEQFRAETATPKSDQFSFCVTLWEALYGQRPFAGDTLASLAANVLSGSVRSAPPGRRVPAWLKRICQRGLSVDPERRFDDMQTLLSAFARAVAAGRRRRVVVAVGSVAIAGAATWGWHEWSTSRRVVACESEGDAITAMWDGAARERTSRQLMESGVPYAQHTSDQVLSLLDERVQRLRVAQVEVCKRAEVHRTWAPERVAKAQWCLDARREDLAARISDGQWDTEHAVRGAVTGLSTAEPIAPCVDEASLIAAPAPPDEALHDSIRQVQRDLGRASVLARRGEREEALALVRDASRRADSVGWAPLKARVQLREAGLLSQIGDSGAAAAKGEEAYMVAAGAGAWALAADAACSNIYYNGVGIRAAEVARTWGRHCEMAARHSMNPTGLREARRRDSLGSVELAAGEYDAAMEHWSAARALYEQTLGNDHPDLGRTLTQLARVSIARGEYEEAELHATRALQILERVLGEEHPELSRPLVLVGNVHFQRGETEAAIPHWERSLGLLRQDPTALASVIAGRLNNLGMAHESLGEFDAARREFEDALHIWEREQDANDPAHASTLTNLGNLLLKTAKPSEARRRFERARDIRAAGLAPEHPHHAWSWLGIGRAYLAESSPELAIEPLEAALRIRSASDPDPRRLAEVEFELARALWDSAPSQDRDEIRARALAEDARKRYSDKSEISARELAEVRAWLDAHPAG